LHKNDVSDRINQFGNMNGIIIQTNPRRGEEREATVNVMTDMSVSVQAMIERRRDQIIILIEGGRNAERI